MNTITLQSALKALGFDPGPIDGLPGPQTRAALKAYQRSRHLPESGLADPQTMTMLSVSGAAGRSTRSVPPWYLEGRRNLGLTEVRGPEHNPTIVGWAQRLGARVLGIKVTDDETPWCGLFAAYCISATLPDEPLPSIAVRASSWDKFGIPLRTPSLGAVLRFSRRGGGHVGFYAGEDDDRFHVLGGNQRNRVSVTPIEKSRIISVRWPATFPRPTEGRVFLQSDAASSRNER